MVNASTGYNDKILIGKRVCVDAGHGGHDSGAVGPSELKEKDANLDIALRLKDDLVALGAEVVMTRENDTFVSLQGRCDVANASNSDIFIAVHNNSWTNPAKHGTEGYQSRTASPDSAALNRAIYTHMEQDLPTKGNGIHEAGFYVLRHTNMPAMLAEVAYVSNPLEEALLKSADFREKAAQAIADGVVDYFQRREQPPTWNPTPLPSENYLTCSGAVPSPSRS